MKQGLSRIRHSRPAYVPPPVKSEKWKQQRDDDPLVACPACGFRQEIAAMCAACECPMGRGDT